MSTQNNLLTTKSFWEKTQGEIDFSGADQNLIIAWLEKIMGSLPRGSVFEIGCYPGKYLLPFARSGYSVSGIDYLDNTRKVEEFFRANDFKVGQFYQEDLFAARLPEQYDVVTSFGFIEHFKDFRKIIEIQAGLVKPGGTIILEVPNFKGVFQKIPRFLFDHSNYKKHNLEAMDPAAWIKILEVHGFGDFKVDYWDTYKVWYEKKRNKGALLFLRNSIETLAYKMIRTFRKMPLKHYSPYITLVGKKLK